MANTAQQSSSFSSNSVQSLGNVGNHVDGQSPVEFGNAAKWETTQGAHGESEALVQNVGNHVGVPVMLVPPMIPPVALGPPRNISKTPPKRTLASSSRSESSPPDRGGMLARQAKKGATSDGEAYSSDGSERTMWKFHTESMLLEQKARFEVVADEWMAASRSMFKSEQQGIQARIGI